MNMSFTFQLRILVTFALQIASTHAETEVRLTLATDGQGLILTNQLNQINYHSYGFSLNRFSFSKVMLSISTSLSGTCIQK